MKCFDGDLRFVVMILQVSSVMEVHEQVSVTTSEVLSCEKLGKWVLFLTEE